MAEDTKKPVDLKNLDLKDLGGILKAAFGKILERSVIPH